MFVLSNFIYSLAVIARIVVELEMFSVILSTVFSWIAPGVYSSVRIFFQVLSDFIMKPIKRILPGLVVGGVDLSPVIAILLLVFIDQFLIATLFDLAHRLR
ncbi:YggT family protein [Kosmotoga pacifica]|uniref:YggT family protein n=1 Tax=Kosmotoga pacifica TaxID=1330330 RepID=A0A0G2Z5C7_9BACT|nr:YggT family protein [Kosmotoga pacifica]AKI96772.1 hypothetical protein IX53_01870 [Kosmotoga pacifica]